MVPSNSVDDGKRLCNSQAFDFLRSKLSQWAKHRAYEISIGTITDEKEKGE